jgi:hypothetical protein
VTGDVKALTKSTTAKELFNRFSNIDNPIVRRVSCDALTHKEFSKAVGISREDYCTSHGLARYMAVAERYVSEEHLYSSPSGDTQYFYGSEESGVLSPR